MNRKTFLQQLGLVTAGTALTPALFNWIKQNGPFYPIRNNVGYFTGRGGTIGWHITNESVAVIDSQFQNSAEDFMAGIFDFGPGGPARYLFNTHHHGDHVSGNGVFRSGNFEIIAHQNVPELQRESAGSNSESVVAANRVFDDEITVESGSEIITAKYYGRAHTRGDSVIWFENANIAHMGDLVFNRWYPFIDTNGGALIENWISMLEIVANEATADTRFIFGHGNRDFGVTGSSDDLLYMRDYLSKLMEHTQAGIQAGQSPEEISAIEQFEEFPDHQSAGARLSLQSNIEAAYAELTS